MTGLLKDLMHEHADALAAPDLDVDAMVREGGRRVGRRRTTLVGGCAAVAVAAAVALPSVLSSAPEGTTDPLTGTFGAQDPVYAVGATLHVGGREVVLPTAVRSLVQTDHGVVHADRTGAVWSTTADGSQQVGTADRRFPQLVADGSLAAWVDTAADVPAFSVLDQTTGEVVSSALGNTSSMGTVRDEAEPAVVYALDGDVLYLRDPRGAVAWNHRTDDQRVLGDADGFTIDDVQGGQIAYQPAVQDSATPDYRVGPDLTSGRRLAAWSAFALSPGATYLLGEDEPDRATLFVVATGEAIDALPDGYAFFAGYGWVDDDTYVGIGLNKPWERTPVDLLTCDVAGACTVTAEAVGTLEDGLVLPFGEAE